MRNKRARQPIALIAVFALMGLIDLADAHQPTAYITVPPVNTGQTYVPSLRLLSGVATGLSSKPLPITLSLMALEWPCRMT